jgi:filamentous hemagglutinin family protein
MNRHGSMNRIYRLVWSAVRSVWIPVAETARGRGKRSTPKLVAAAWSLSCAIAQASPSGGQVTAGTGSITQSGATTTITQSTQNLALSWTSFNIAPQQSVNFVQPAASAIAVNRILGTNGTEILGYLHANGQVFLINPNGIVFGPSAEVNVGGLVASTLDLNEADTPGNTKTFSGTGTGAVLNQGTLTAAQGGYVVLLGNHVSNEGVISAQLGTVALGAGSAITLTFADNSRLHLQVDQSALNSLAENGGLIRADGGQVIMTAGARDTLLASAVNNTGLIEARTVDTHDGTITLLGGMTAGTVHVAGTLDASAPQGGNGGQINTSAAHVEVAGDTRVTTAARDGLFGSWLIDPEDYTVAASGGDITGAALSSDLGTTNIVLQSSAGTMTPGGSGNVNVNDAVTWSANTTLTLTASNSVNVTANISATGDTAGLIINPNTTNGTGGSTQTQTGTGTFNLTGASITLTGATPFLSISGTTYTVINTLGAPGSMTATDLQGMNGNLAGNYALGSNIDASPTATPAWNNSAGFAPIGTATTSFTGTFDGLGHTITDFTINLPATNNVGLFGYLGPASIIQNVGLVGGRVSGDNDVGELVGYNNRGNIRNSYTTGDVSGAGSTIGGLVGDSLYGTISSSFATGTVSGSGDNIGGLVGFNVLSTINTSYATGNVIGTGYGINIGGLAGASFGGSINSSNASGNVSGANQVGGLVGTLEGNGTVANSYATGSVSGNKFVGGLVGVFSFGAISDAYATGSVSATGGYVGGLLGYGDRGAISNSYAIGAVSGGNYVGGLVGFNSGITINTSYWNTSTNPAIPGVGAGSLGAAMGLTTLQMQTAANFAGFAFTTTPGAPGNDWVMVDTDGTLNNGGSASGATFPMLSSEYSTVITNAHQLQLIAMALGASYTLAANIDAAATDTSTTLGDVWSTPGGFVPIGNNSANFTGSFNGQGHTISNLTINLPAAAGVGLFGYTSATSAIQNVGLVGGSVAGLDSTGDLVGVLGGALNDSSATGAVSGTDNVGGLVGYSHGGAISSSFATGTVTGTGAQGGANIGGLVGQTDANSTVVGSVAAGAVTGGGNVGGLVGYNYGSSISTSLATGTVTGTAGASSSVGGLVGNNYGNATITISYADGVVAGYTNVGGLAGSNTGRINGSFATGHVSSTNVTAGGLVGNNPGGTITNSHATGTVTGSSYVGGLVGIGSGRIRNSHATGDVTSGGNFIGGLVGNFQAGTISDSYATGGVNGGADVGGLVGSNQGSISESHAGTGAVNGTGSQVGGLVGANSYNGTIASSYATGVVTGTAEAGGLAGFNTYNASIVTSFAAGAVTGSSDVGGLVGTNNGAISTSHATGSVSVGSGNYAGGLVGGDRGTVESTYATGVVTGGSYVGGLVGQATGQGTDPISNSYATGAVSGASNVGGLVGQNAFTITNSYATGNVRGTGTAVGGLVGSNGGGYGTVANSYATGTVSSSGSIAGGLVGNNYGGISNSYATGAVTATMSVGGLVGINSSGGTISNTYATGSVAGTGNAVGGLLGGNQGTITDSFWNSNINGIGVGTGSTTGATALSTAGMMTMSNFASAGWNISDTGGSGDLWRIYEGDTAPLLVSFLTPLTVTAQSTTHTYTGTPDTGLIDASYSVTGAATSGHIFNLDNSYNGAVSVGTYGADLYSDQLGYDISYVNATMTVTPATLTVTANAAGKVYGQPNPALSGTVAGFVGGETLASATTGSETFATAATATSNVGSYAITGSGLMANNGNYTFSFAAANATAFSITPAMLTVSGEVAASRIYNGTTDATLTGGTLNGMASGDTVTLTKVGHFTSPAAGTGVPVTATDALDGAGAGNYVLTEPTDIVANITPAMLTYTAASASFTAGQTPSGLSGTLAGFVAGDTELNATTGTLAWITTAGAASAPGHYAIDGSGLTAANYVFVDAAANATALTLLTQVAPPSGPTAPSTASLLEAQDAVTSIEANLPSSQTNIQLAMLDLSTNVAETQSLDGNTHVATEPADTIVLDKRSVHAAMVSSLRVVRGGVRLPNDRINIDAP